MISIEVPQSALSLLFDSGQGTTEAPGGVKLELGRAPVEKRSGLTWDAFPTAQVLVSASSFARDVVIGVFSAWLYDKLKSDKVSQHMGITKIRVNREVVEITPEAIPRAVRECVEIEIKAKE